MAIEKMKYSLPFCAIDVATGWATAEGAGWAAACRLAGLAAWMKQNGLAQVWVLKQAPQLVLKCYSNNH